MNERSWGGGNGARSVKREKLRLWRKKTLPLLSSFYKPSGGGLPPALCHQEPSPVTFSFRIHHQMPTSDHSHLPPTSQVRKSLWRASRRFAAAVIFLYEDIAKQKRTNVAKICKIKTILRCLRDLAFRGGHCFCCPFTFPVKLIIVLRASVTQDPPALWQSVFSYSLVISHKILQSGAITHSSYR